MTTEIPLLPLPAVLFPGTMLPVQISAEAQKALLRSCVDQGRRLGVVLAHNGDHRVTSTYSTGCLASVALMLSDTQEDQPINAVLYGEQRIRTVEFTRHAPYASCRVTMLEDHPGMNAHRRLLQATDLFRQYLDLIKQRYMTESVDFSVPNDPTRASYLLGSVLSLPLEVKQRWLESPSAAMRLEEQRAFLESECEKLATLLALSAHTHFRYSHHDYDSLASLISLN